MATLGLGIVGALAGSVFGSPQLGFQLGTTAGSLLFPSQQQQTDSLADVRIGGSSFGTPVPSIYGAGGNGYAAQLVWSTPLAQDGQAGGNKKVQGQWQYSVSMMVLLCASNPYITDGTVQIRLYADDVIIWDTQAGAVFEGLTRVTFYDGNPSQTADPTILASDGFATAYRGRVCVFVEGMDLTPFGNNRPSLRYEMYTEATTLAQIIDDFATTRSTLTTAELDTSLVTGISVEGFNAPGKTTRADPLSGLLTCYHVDTVEGDGVIRFVPQGGAIIGTVALADLGMSTGGERVADTLVTELDMAETEMPSLMTMRYVASDQQFNAGEVTELNTLAPFDNEMSKSVPVTLDKPTAQTILRSLLYQFLVGRQSYEFRVPISYLAMLPTDPWMLTLDDGTTVRVKITAVPWQPNDPMLKVTAVADDPNVLIQFADVASAPPQMGTLLPSIPNMAFGAFSGLEVSDADATAAGFYVYAFLAGGTSVGTIYWSTDPTFATGVVNAGSISGTAAFGNTTDTLATAAPGWDSTDTVTVLTTGEGLDDASMSAVPPTNIALIGIGGGLSSYEYLGFTTATLLYPANYTLSELLRGYRNSPTSGHTSADPFVLMDQNVVRVQVPLSLVGQNIYIKVISGYLPPTYSGVSAIEVNIATPSGSAALAAPSSVVASAPGYDASGNMITTFSAIYSSPLANPSANISYLWEYSTNSGSSWSSGVSTGLVYTPPGIASGTIMVRVQAVNNLGSSAFVDSSNISFVAAPSAVTHWAVDSFVGDGSTTTFTLSYTPVSDAAFVFVNGAMQIPGVDFTTTGGVLTFLTGAPPAPITGGTKNVVVQYSH